MLIGTAGVSFSLWPLMHWGDNRWEPMLTLILASGLIGGGYGVFRVQRWGRMIMLAEMPAVLLWCLGWLWFMLENLDAVGAFLFIAGCICTVITFSICLRWQH